MRRERVRETQQYHPVVYLILHLTLKESTLMRQKGNLYHNGCPPTKPLPLRFCLTIC